MIYTNLSTNRRSEQGATSLIIVMFSALVFTVIAVGFMQLMIQEQRASQDSELSQGAYDSALAGAEDGKRVLRACLDGDTDSCTAIDDQKCTTVSDAGFTAASTNGEVVLRSNVSGFSSSDGEDYAQAYTCVKITRDTTDILGALTKDVSIVQSLATNPGDSFDTLVIKWFKRQNANSDNVFLDPVGNSSVQLPGASAWSVDQPPVLRVQLIQYGTDNPITTSDFDDTNDSATLYLYPKRAGASSVPFSLDNRRSGTLVPYAVSCAPTFLGNNGYACQAMVQLPNPEGSDAAHRKAYVRMTALYNNADFSIQAQQGTASNATPVPFAGVQPSIDSTGRAADVYRRVQQRVQAVAPTSPLYPRATVDTTSNFCKNFSVSASAAQFVDSCPVLP